MLGLKILLCPRNRKFHCFYNVFSLDSTSYVVIELCDENTSVTKISPPLLTAGLSNIRLKLTTPQLASVRVRS